MDRCSRGSASHWRGCAGPVKAASRRGTKPFKDETKRGFCPNKALKSSHVAAFDYGDTNIGINLSALDNQDDPRLVPVNQSFRDDAVSWLPQVPDTQHSSSADARVAGAA